MMRKHLHLSVAAILGLGVLIASCDKNDDNGPAAPSNEMKLEAHTWQVTAVTFSDTGVTDSSFYTACMDDDSLNFTTGHNFSFSDGTTACDSSLVGYGSGEWAFNGAEDTLSLKYSDTTVNWQVKSLTDSTFQISYADSLSHRTGTKTLTFAAKQ